MEPLAALGLAANVAQFLEYTSNVFRNIKDIRSTGDTATAKHLGSLAKDISNANTSLVGQYQGFISGSLSEEEKVGIAYSEVTGAWLTFMTQTHRHYVPWPRTVRKLLLK
jgi:hypothetical protein